MKKSSNGKNYPLYSSETVNLALPLARREANTLRPLAVAILERKPCLFFLLKCSFHLSVYYLLLSYSHTNLGCKDRGFFLINKELQEKLYLHQDSFSHKYDIQSTSPFSTIFFISVLISLTAVLLTFGSLVSTAPAATRNLSS